jgi:metal-responsive CopG/Arc/MetJ family transcriptional regulator
MPDQRSKDKHVFGVSLDKGLLKKIDAHCASEGITRTEFFRRMADLKLKPNNKEAK